MILLVITGLREGGAERQLHNLCRHIISTEAATVVSLCSGGPYQDRLKAIGVDVYSLDMTPGRPSISGFFRYLKLLLQLRPRIVVSFMYHANLLASAGSLFYQPHIRISSIRNIQFGGRLSGTLQRLSDLSATYVVTNSKTNLKSLIDRRIVSPIKGRYIPNFLSPEFETNMASAVARPHPGTDRWKLISIGRLHPQKDYPLLLSAIQILKQNGHSIQLRIVGEGDQLPELLKLLDSLEIASEVEFLGRRNDVRELMMESDLLVLSSAWEGMPNVLLEAMATGLPAVGMDVGGVGELLIHCQTGILVTDRSPLALAKAIESYFALPTTAQRLMSSQSLEVARNTFSSRAVWGRWERLISGEVATN